MLLADLLFAYPQFDMGRFIEGDGPPPAVVLAMIKRLPEDSYTVAVASGGEHMFGWNTERHLLASIFDAVNTNTRATANWKGSPPKPVTWPRPKPKEKPLTNEQMLDKLFGSYLSGGGALL